MSWERFGFKLRSSLFAAYSTTPLALIGCDPKSTSLGLCLSDFG